MLNLIFTPCLVYRPTSFNICQSLIYIYMCLILYITVELPKH